LSREPNWLDERMVLAIHHEMLASYGGVPGVDRGKLAGALARPLHLYGYGPESMTRLAASYLMAIVKGQAFVDGNKRTALMSCYVFLELNGHSLDATEADAVMKVERVAACGQPPEDLVSRIGEWLDRVCSRHTTSRSDA